MNGFGIGKTYDVVFIGQLGAVVANQFLKNSQVHYKILVINSKRQICQPSVGHSCSNIINLIKLAPQNCDIQTKNILRIKPLSRQITMQNDKVYYYKLLVYSDNEAWINYNCISTLKQALSNEYSLVYSNYLKNDLSRIYKYNYGNLVFYIPKGRHSGYENFCFLSVYNKFINSGTSVQNNFRCKIILQGNCFFPYFPQADEIIKKEIISYGIEIVYNSKITKIDYLRRKLTINENTEIPYTIFYCVIPQCTPQILSNAEIDPYNNHSKTLMNRQYKNIFIFGADIYPTTHSFTAINHQVHVIRHNLLNKLLKKTDLAFYNGYTAFKFWINEKNAITLSQSYEKTYQTNQHCCSTYLSAINSRLFGNFQIQTFYNLSSDGRPFYFFSPNLMDNRASMSQNEQKNSQRCLKSNNNIEIIHNKMRCSKPQ